MRLLRSLPLLVLPATASAQLPSFADYWPLELGYSWEFTSTQAPFDTYRFDVIEEFSFKGAPTYRVGPDAMNCFLLYNDGASFFLRGNVDEGTEHDLVPDVVLGTFADGASYSTAPGELTVLRAWDTLGSIKDGLGLSSALPGLVLEVWYDTDYAATPSTNAMVESGGVSYPYGVTDLTWYAPGIGPIASLGVQAENGALEDLYLVEASFDCNGNQVADPADIASGGSLDIDGDGVPDECVAPLLAIDAHAVSVSAGGTRTFALNAGAAHGGQLHLLLGSASGTSPGVGIDGLTLPLNVDAYFVHSLTAANAPPFGGSFGTLAADGTASATLTLPAASSASLVGAELHHAYVAIGLVPVPAVALASNAVPLWLVP